MFEGSLRDVFRLLRLEKGAAFLEDPELVAPYARAVCENEVLMRVSEMQIPVTASGRVKITKCPMEARVHTVLTKCVHDVVCETSRYYRRGWSFEARKERAVRRFIYHDLPPDCTLRRLFEDETDSDEDAYGERCKVCACIGCGAGIYVFSENCTRRCNLCRG